MRTLNIGLKKAIGMPFTYKFKLQEFLTELKTSEAVVANLSAPQLSLLSTYTDNFIRCTPALGFSSKQYAYQALEVVVQAFLSGGSTVDAPTQVELSRGLLSVLKYVGIEGETDYHFQVETFKLAEIISSVTGEVVEADQSPATGSIVSFVVFDGGSGYSVDGTGISVGLESSETDESVMAIGEVDISGGKVVEKAYTISGGDGSGFSVGQIILIVDDGVDTEITYDNVALAEVISVA
jgi:hypothetical protein